MSVFSDQIDPLHYPWSPPKASGVLHGDDFLPLQLAADLPLGRSMLLDGADDSLSSCLNEALAAANAEPLDSRSPVVSIGSNSSPEVLRRKFGSSGYPVSRILPLARAQLHHIGVGHSAHVSMAGYIAAAPYPHRGRRSTVWVAWLDACQLAALDETEPNYRRIELNNEDCPLVLDNGERPETFSLFASRWGVLTDGQGRKLPFLEQSALFQLLAGSVAAEYLQDGQSVFEGPPERVAEQLAMPSVQAGAKEWFRAAGLAVQVDLGAVGLG
ncbi:hypothetical protein [Arthrobacter sp. ZGTC131]|uniref:hypothetical protein n=1 Tax=Arthrobacter sp. ZGTC131 TaxID=2058898 RepID=UPI000CE41478|nr:hypothetical protein [Arthrobacter sp. ZGTC131]